MAETNHRRLAIILGATLGSLAVALVIGAVWYVQRRKSKGPILTRCVTPLDDAEFESWRRPSKQIQWRDKLSFPSQPPPALTRFPSRASKHRPASLAMAENDTKVPIYEYRPRPIRTPDQGHRYPDHKRSKSSMSTIHSIQDRPPTPYSPTSMSTRPFTQHGSPRVSGVPSMSPKVSHVHYPSVSEASDFDFGFQGYDGLYRKM